LTEAVRLAGVRSAVALLVVVLVVGQVVPRAVVQAVGRVAREN